jgi:hypothetical protein
VSPKAERRWSSAELMLGLKASQGRPTLDLRDRPKISVLARAQSGMLRDLVKSMLTDHSAFEAVLSGFRYRRGIAGLHLDVLPRLSL